MNSQKLDTIHPEIIDKIAVTQIGVPVSVLSTLNKSIHSNITRRTQELIRRENYFRNRVLGNNRVTQTLQKSGYCETHKLHPAQNHARRDIMEKVSCIDGDSENVRFQIYSCNHPVLQRDKPNNLVVINEKVGTYKGSLSLELRLQDSDKKYPEISIYASHLLKCLFDGQNHEYIVETKANPYSPVLVQLILHVKIKIEELFAEFFLDVEPLLCKHKVQKVKCCKQVFEDYEFCVEHAKFGERIIEKDACHFCIWEGSTDMVSKNP